MANVDAVPAGSYGKAALESLGVWDGVADRVAQAENVRAALALVATGEAPLGIVYQTDAAADPAVRIVGTFPEDTHPPIVYPAAVTAEATERRRRRLPRLPAVAGGARTSSRRRASRCWRRCGELTGAAERWSGCASVPTNGPRSASPSRSRPGRRSSACRSASSSRSLLARREFPGKALLNGLVHLPLILPPVVTGYLLLLTFGRRGPVGRLPRRSISASSSPSAGPARRSPAGSWPSR